jgi:metallo-beta-lactamase class B
MPRAAATSFATVFTAALALQGTPAAHAACSICPQWNAPQAPFVLFGNTYYVGVKGLSSVLVTTPSGHVLIDGALPESAPRIAASIRALGFRIEDVKYILNSHAHFDHAGGIAELQRLSGATVLAAPIGAQALAAGSPPPEDPQTGDATPFAPVANVRAMRDGEVLELAGLEITMHATPGHTPGGASWTWRACEGGVCANIAYVDSLTLVSAPGYRFTDHADVVAQFHRSAAAIEQLPCDVLVSAHPDFSGLLERHARGALVDPDACRGYARQGRRFITERLASERN